MFQVRRTDPNRLDIILDGRLDSQEMRAALEALERESAGIEHGRMFYDVVDFELPSLKAILIEFSRLPAMLRLIGRFDRAVVLTDRDWLKKASEWEGRLIPHLQVKAFSRDQRLEAEAWLERS